jgi:hypothetical protein
MVLLNKQYEIAMKRMQPVLHEAPIMVSVIIPTYMQYTTLRRAIDSVTSQVWALASYSTVGGTAKYLWGRL